MGEVNEVNGSPDPVEELSPVEHAYRSTGIGALIKGMEVNIKVAMKDLPSAAERGQLLEKIKDNLAKLIDKVKVE